MRKKVYFGVRESKQIRGTQARSAIARRGAKEKEEEVVQGRKRAGQCHRTRWTDVTPETPNGRRQRINIEGCRRKVHSKLTQ